MGTHRTGKDMLSGRRRRLTERCKYCNARAGQPCSDGINGLKPDDFECPDKNCTQVYGNPQDALNCTIHKKDLNQ